MCTTTLTDKYEAYRISRPFVRRRALIRDWQTQDDIAALPATALAGFLRVDARPLKQALASWVAKWIYIFTLYLQNKARPDRSNKLVF